MSGLGRNIQLASGGRYVSTSGISAWQNSHRERNLADASYNRNVLDDIINRRTATTPRAFEGPAGFADGALTEMPELVEVPERRRQRSLPSQISRRTISKTAARYSDALH
jgi:hypothetical protein